MELIVIVGLLLLAIWIANASSATDVVVREKVTSATGSESAGESAGNGCGWILFIVLFLGFMLLVPLSLVATMPVDCQTIAVNRAMGRCP